jgi:hypothetical protein
MVSLMIKYIIVCLLCLLPPLVFANASSNSDDVALALAKAKVTVQSNNDVSNALKLAKEKCLVTTKTEPTPLPRPKPRPTPRPKSSSLSYADACLKAKNENKLLVVWVNCYNEGVAIALSDFVHVRVSSFDGNTKRDVVMIRFTSDGNHVRVNIGMENFTVDRARNSFAPILRGSQTTYIPPQVQYTPAPVQYYYPVGGGVGGSCGAGGCGVGGGFMPMMGGGGCSGGRCR